MVKRSESLNDDPGLGPRPTTPQRRDETRQQTELSLRLQQAGLLTGIPFVLLVGPALGYYLGSRLDSRWSHAPWGVALGTLIGFAASARVTIQLIRQARDLTK